MSQARIIALGDEAPRSRVSLTKRDGAFEIARVLPFDFAKFGRSVNRGNPRKSFLGFLALPCFHGTWLSMGMKVAGTLTALRSPDGDNTRMESQSIDERWILRPDEAPNYPV
jgi:hypothetical protein